MTAGYPHPPEVVQKIGDLWRLGWPSGDIAKELSMTRNQVIGLVNRFRQKDGAELWPMRTGTKGGGKPLKRQKATPVRPQPPHSAVKKKQVPDSPRTLPSIPEPSRPVKTDPIKFVLRSLERCAWPLPDEIPGPDMLCCGSKTELGFVYCGFHRNIARQPRMRTA